jgi:hypothetical protein
MSIDTYQVRKIEPPPADFLMTPEQHRRGAQDMRNAGRPDLAKHHEILAQAIERRRRGRPKALSNTSSPGATPRSLGPSCGRRRNQELTVETEHIRKQTSAERDPAARRSTKC